MKVNVNSENLLLAAFGVPNVSSADMTFHMKQGTHGLYRDFFAGRDVEDVMGLECPELLPVYNAIIEWKKQWPRPGLRYPQERIKERLKTVLAEQCAPETVEMPAYRSIYAILAVLTEIEHFTGYDLKETQKQLQLYSGGVPISILPTVLKYDKSVPFAEMAYEVRHWYNINKPPVGCFGQMAVWKANFSEFVEQLIKKYKAPLYFKV